MTKDALLVDHLNDTMKEIYVPDKDLSLDESMMLWRGRLVFWQYIKSKKQIWREVLGDMQVRWVKASI